jgi:dolichyl-phosphate-mannose-protein mannosyltransferase
MRAAREKLWYDEILTFDVATLVPSLGTFWSFLKNAEASPPLGFLLAAGSESVFGRNEFGLRLPSVVAFWIMALCLYVYLGRRIPRSYAIAAALLAALTAAGRYSYEARPYALVFALAGIALVAWQAAAEGRGRRTALVTLGIALMAALFSHPLAVTLALPFLAGELTRTVQRKRVDWPVWCAFASATPMLLVIWKMQTAGKSTTYLRFVGSRFWHIGVTYMEMLGPALVPLVLAFLLLLALRPQAGNSAKSPSVMRAYELAALAGFALIPVAAILLLSAVNGMYFLRYSLNGTIGLAGLIAVLLCRIGGTNRLSEITVLAVFGLAFAVVQFLPEEKRPDFGLKVVNTSEKIQLFLERIPSDAPIAISAPMTFVELEHYCSPGLAARLYYLTDPAAAAAIDGNVLFDLKTPVLAQFFPFRAHFEDYHSFIAAHKRFYVVQPVRNIAREHSLGRLNLQAQETADHFQYYEARPR